MTTVAYVSHPFGGLRENLEATEWWLRWMLRLAPEVAWIAPWLTDCKVLDDANDEHHDAGLTRDAAIVRRCDAVVLLGEKVSRGMAAEAAVANRVYDLTGALYVDDDEMASDDPIHAVYGVGGGAEVQVHPSDILGRVVAGRWVSLPYARVDRSWFGVTCPVWAPRWACTADELRRWR